VDRRLLKCILDIDEKDLPEPAVRMKVLAETHESEKFHRALEAMIASHFKMTEDDLVICKVVGSSAVKTESEVLVLKPGQKESRFHEESVLFGTVNEAILKQKFQVYSPVTYKDEKDKSKREREFREVILSMIGRLAAQNAQTDKKTSTERN
jgi:hypothetical protein